MYSNLALDFIKTPLGAPRHLAVARRRSFRDTDSAPPEEPVLASDGCNDPRFLMLVPYCPIGKYPLRCPDTSFGRQGWTTEVSKSKCEAELPGEGYQVCNPGMTLLAAADLAVCRSWLCWKHTEATISIPLSFRCRKKGFGVPLTPLPHWMRDFELPHIQRLPHKFRARVCSATQYHLMDLHGTYSCKVV